MVLIWAAGATLHDVFVRMMADSACQKHICMTAAGIPMGDK
jgi:hypothetical protein